MFHFDTEFRPQGKNVPEAYCNGLKQPNEGEI